MCLPMAGPARTLLNLGYLLRIVRGPMQLYTVNPFRTAVPFWGQTPQILSDVSPKRDRGPKRAKARYREASVWHSVWR